MLEMDILGVSLSEEHHPPVVLLRHGDRVLPIVVGRAEAQAIHTGMIHQDLGRPMTHDLICNVLAGLRGELKSVTIYKLENETFYAHLNVEQQSVDGQVEQVLRIDSRPSDGIAIATRVGCPIFAAEEVLEIAGQDVANLGPGDDEDEEDDEFE
ncbi:MAG TPA: bifunctional nuclease family protein [Candidatus Hydrogenedentes bacterium]|jgi:hypothetical protein|nr:bifunctional nuclease family protein [Candidatus Hydrogenedentota bacterium]HPJ97943.1 bifunctional nuclease family protein [Candidatus Hydrogenedentota bacterium]